MYSTFSLPWCEIPGRVGVARPSLQSEGPLPLPWYPSDRSKTTQHEAMSTPSSPSPLSSLTDSFIITVPSRPSSRCLKRSTPSHYNHHTASRILAQPAARISRHPYDRGRRHIVLISLNGANTRTSTTGYLLHVLSPVPRQLSPPCC
ncbi:hypothetical protein HZ326_0193 [Fusarium oxysporum f. sp. albedinis]|nr:hypothetical protein HZ326_0193 [Fusarium oxysporum f. sp. albedinis]